MDKYIEVLPEVVSILIPLLGAIGGAIAWVYRRNKAKIDSVSSLVTTSVDLVEGVRKDMKEVRAEYDELHLEHEELKKKSEENAELSTLYLTKYQEMNVKYTALIKIHEELINAYASIESKLGEEVKKRQALEERVGIYEKQVAALMNENRLLLRENETLKLTGKKGKTL